MTVLHLPGRVPNAGALRLFGWLAAQADLAGAIAEVESFIGEGRVQRLIAGELLPCHDMGAGLAQATLGAIDARGWRTQTRAWWFGEFAAVRSRGAADAAMRERIARMPRAASLPLPGKYRRKAA